MTTNFPDTFQHSRNGRASFKRALRSELVYNAVRQRIGKWNTELQQVSTRFFQCECNLNRVRKTRVAGTNIWNKGRAILVPALHKKTFDSFGHRWHS